MSALCSLSPPESDLDPSFSDDEVASTVNDGDGSVMEEDLKLQVSAIPHRIPKRQVSKLLKGKEREWAQSLDRRERLQLLDLPTDVLKEIVSQVTNTNDLAALALTHSALHDLAIPHIYSRFDIVWPDASSSVEPRTGVDALTYGLSTLVMHEDAFRSYPTTKTCHHCGNIVRSNDQDSFAEPRKRRRGNNYAQYTRKFSLGNGPKDWVKEYSIDREGARCWGPWPLWQSQGCATWKRSRGTCRLGSCETSGEHSLPWETAVIVTSPDLNASGFDGTTTLRWILSPLFLLRQHHNLALLQMSQLSIPPPVGMSLLKPHPQQAYSKRCRKLTTALKVLRSRFFLR